MNVVINVILCHLIFSCLLYILSEILLMVFADKIRDNGWTKTQELEEFQKNRADTYTLFDYSLPMFIPVLNILCLLDVINLITTKYE